jgi:hypothetical protein
MMGIIFDELPVGNRAENQRRAIVCYEAALRVYTESDFPQDWAMTQNNLGIAYRNLPTGDRGENLRRAIACYKMAARGFASVGLDEDAAQIAETVAQIDVVLAAAEGGDVETTDGEGQR